MAPADVSVVVPCFNEAENLPELVERLQHAFSAGGFSGEIVLVNDGSRDATGGVIRDLERRHTNVVGRHHQQNRGMEAGWNTGVDAARGTYVCLIDADLQYQPEDVARLHAEIVASGADVVQGCRITPGSARDSRYVLSRGLNFILNRAFGMRLRDNKSGFVLARRETLRHVLEHRRRYRFFQALLLVSAHAKGYSVREIETVFAPRRRGQSFMSGLPVKVVAGCLLDVLNGVMEFRRRPRAP
jgi:phenylacetate-CoA ligase